MKTLKAPANYWLFGVATGVALICLSALWPAAFWIGMVGFCLVMAWLNYRPCREPEPESFVGHILAEYNGPRRYYSKPVLPPPAARLDGLARAPKPSTFWQDVSRRIKQNSTLTVRL